MAWNAVKKNTGRHDHRSFNKFHTWTIIMKSLRKFSFAVEAWIVGIGLFAFLGLMDIFAASIF